MCIIIRYKNQTHNFDIIVLGIAQDGGIPQIFCDCHNCKNYHHLVASIALYDRKTQKCFIIDATPDIIQQMKLMKDHTGKTVPEGILLTHKHYGHVAGLAALGFESANESIHIYAGPKLLDYLNTNDYFSSKLGTSTTVQPNHIYYLTPDLSVEPFLVEHRGEETYGYLICYENKQTIYLPDVDEIDTSVMNRIKRLKNRDTLIIDGTFYEPSESKRLETTSILKHPFIKYTMEQLEHIRSNGIQIYFTHFNHTNKVLSSRASDVSRRGYKLLKDGMILHIG